MMNFGDRDSVLELLIHWFYFIENWKEFHTPLVEDQAFRFAFYCFPKIILLLLLSFFATFFLCE